MGDLTVDPAFGWQYGFPKVWNGEGDMYEWLVKEGYPADLAKDIKENNLWIRFIGSKEDLEEHLRLAKIATMLVSGTREELVNHIMKLEEENNKLRQSLTYVI